MYHDKSQNAIFLILILISVFWFLVSCSCFWFVIAKKFMFVFYGSRCYKFLSVFSIPNSRISTFLILLASSKPNRNFPRLVAETERSRWRRVPIWGNPSDQRIRVTTGSSRFLWRLYSIVRLGNFVRTILRPWSSRLLPTDPWWGHMLDADKNRIHIQHGLSETLARSCLFWRWFMVYFKSPS